VKRASWNRGLGSLGVDTNMRSLIASVAVYSELSANTKLTGWWNRCRSARDWFCRKSRLIQLVAAMESRPAVAAYKVLMVSLETARCSGPKASKLGSL
jgi:hypothetical protein